MYVCMYVCMCVCVLMYVYMYVCLYECMDTMKNSMDITQTYYIILKKKLLWLLCKSNLPGYEIKIYIN